MIPDTIKRLRELDAEATKPPWKATEVYTIAQDGGKHKQLMSVSSPPSGTHKERHANTALTVALRNSLPALLAEIDRLRAIEVTARACFIAWAGDWTVEQHKTLMAHCHGDLADRAHVLAVADHPWKEISHLTFAGTVRMIVDALAAGEAGK